MRSRFLHGALGTVLVLSALASSVSAAHHIKRYARIQIGGRTVYGVVEGDRVRELDGDLFGAPRPTDRTHALSEVKILAPTKPTKVFGAAANYLAPGATRGEKPELFLKTVTSVTGPGNAIVVPEGAENVVYESELVLVIGRRAKNVGVDEALDYVFGVTCGNDVTAADWNESDLQWWRGKGADTFAPVGPYIVTGVDYTDPDLEFVLSVNGEEATRGTMGRLAFSPAELVSFASQHVTLEPGDLIYCGAAGAPGPAKAGDVVEVEIEGVGVLRNPVDEE